jgi:hypothetical protein
MRRMLVYGNRQAEAIATVLGENSRIRDLVRITYLSSFDDVAACREQLSDGDVANYTILCEQYQPQTFPCRDRLAQTCFNLKFPALDSNLLWPFYCVNPYNVAEPPDLPFGRFPYGDRIIVDAIDQRMAPGEILDYYIGGWNHYQIDLDRFRSLETGRITEREIQCDVKMAEYILQYLAKRKLFWTVDHPTAILLEELIERILSACGRVEPRLLDADVRAALETRFGSKGAVGQMGIPIHPKVAEYFELEWYDPNEKFRGWDGTMYSYTEYFSAMIRHAYAVKEQRA